MEILTELYAATLSDKNICYLLASVLHSSQFSARKVCYVSDLMSKECLLANFAASYFQKSFCRKCCVYSTFRNTALSYGSICRFVLYTLLALLIAGHMTELRMSCEFTLHTFQGQPTITVHICMTGTPTHTSCSKITFFPNGDIHLHPISSSRARQRIR